MSRNTSTDRVEASAVDADAVDEGRAEARRLARRLTRVRDAAMRVGLVRDALASHGPHRLLQEIGEIVAAVQVQHVQRRVVQPGEVSQVSDLPLENHSK